MKRRLAMSAMGYGIVFVIILGIIMIVSAPMLVNNTKKENNQSTNENISENDADNVRGSRENFDNSELQNLEQRLTARIENLENRQNSQQSSSSSSSTNKFVCTMEGALDASGEVIPLETPNRSDKIVFVCEYR